MKTFKLLGETRDNGVVWFDQNPHAFPVGSKFYVETKDTDANPTSRSARFTSQAENTPTLAP